MIKLKETNLFRLLIRDNRDLWVRIAVASAVAGIAQGGIVVVLKNAATHLGKGNLDFRDLFMFVTLLLLYAFNSNYAGAKSVSRTVDTMFDTYVKLARRIRNTDLRAFETMGKATIYARLNADSDIIVETSKSLAGIFAALVMILFCSLYIAFLSKAALLLIVLLYILGILTYTSILNRAHPKLASASTLTEDFLSIFKHFIEGFKEIKMSRSKGDGLYEDHLLKKADLAKNRKQDAERLLHHTIVFIQSYYYTMIAGTIFLLPGVASISPQTIVAVAFVVLFSYGSVTRIVAAMPMLLKAEHAARRINDLDSELALADDMDRLSPDNPLKAKGAGLLLTIKDMEFHYAGQNGEPAFSVGPVTAEIRSGELVLVTGGNGSGKSTFLKLVAGLYYPDEGHLALNQMRINRHNYQHYREYFSVIFQDYYLFDRFYGNGRIEKTKVSGLIKEMGLAGKTGFEEGWFTNLKLSAGQRKRLALIACEVEDREILIFDEIAADLDPEFREFFYTVYLKKLTSMGKIVIAVSHDKRYFRTADRIIRLDYGRHVSPDRDNNINLS